jgi:hypothetical protein
MRMIYDYTKEVLERVSFNPDLFTKELKKAVKFTPYEMEHLRIGLIFSQSSFQNLNSVF